MHFLEDRVADITILTAQFEYLDASNAPQVKEAIQPFLANRRSVIIDLGAVAFVDSSGLSAMLSALKIVNANDGDLKLCGMTRKVRALFELVRMHRVFEIYNDRQEAIKSFEGGADAGASRHAASA